MSGFPHCPEIPGAAIDHLNARTVALTTGEELPADLVVLANGYSSMSDWAAQLISPEVARKVGPC